jgi:glycosyltransferase involved in cell wall biosynthesis
LEATVGPWIEQFAALRREFEIILVDDGSTDQTCLVAAKLAVRYPEIALETHEAQRGIGAAIRTGLARARHPLLLYCPTQDQYQATDFSHFLKWIDKADIVAGYRRRKPGSFRSRWRQRWFRWGVRVCFGIPMHDLACYYVLARRAKFARIPIQSDGPFFHAEILAKANFLGCMIHEVPLTDGPQAPKMPAWHAAKPGQTWSEMRRLLSQPDFGPAVLPTRTLDPKQPA